MKRALAVVMILGLCGCSHVPAWLGGTQFPSLKVGDTVVTPPEQVGKAATIDKREGKSSFVIPAGTAVTVTRTEAQAAVGDRPAIPATSVTAYRFEKPSEFLAFDTTTSANSGTVDTSVALHAQDIQSKRPLLYAALASMLGAVVWLFLKFPTPALLCGVASGVFFAAWKLADMPSWVWAVGVAAVGVAVGMHAGFFKGEREPVASTVTTTQTVKDPPANVPAPTGSNT